MAPRTSRPRPSTCAPRVRARSRLHRRLLRPRLSWRASPCPSRRRRRPPSTSPSRLRSPPGRKATARPPRRPTTREPSGGKGGGQAGREARRVADTSRRGGGPLAGGRCLLRLPRLLPEPPRHRFGGAGTKRARPDHHPRGQGVRHERGRQRGEVRRPDGAGFDRGRQPARGDDPCRPAHSLRRRDQDRGRVAGQALEAVLVQGVPCARG